MRLNAGPFGLTRKLNGKPSQSDRLLGRFRVSDATLQECNTRCRTFQAHLPDLIAAEVEDALAKTACYILYTADYARNDRFWPGDFLVFLTNPLNVAYGACGPALFVHSSGPLRKLPPDVIAWMLKQPLSAEDYPPGVYIGLAGIAYTFQEIGFQKKGEEVMAILYESLKKLNPLLVLTKGVSWKPNSLARLLRLRRRRSLHFCS